jgi:hypothetical protein
MHPTGILAYWPSAVRAAWPRWREQDLVVVVKAAVTRRTSLSAPALLPGCYIPPSAVLEWRALLELYHDLRAQHSGWAQRIHAVCFYQGTTGPGQAGVIRGDRG